MALSPEFDNIPQNQEWIDSITEEVARFSCNIEYTVAEIEKDNFTDYPISGDVLAKMNMK